MASSPSPVLTCETYETICEGDKEVGGSGGETLNERHSISQAESHASSEGDWVSSRDECGS
jgi:hypothetical protein